MFKNHFKIALRFLKKNKLFTFINLLGLSIALAVSFIIVLYVVNEKSYNTCHTNRKQVYSVISYDKIGQDKQNGTPFILAETLKDEFPEVIAASNMRRTRLSIKSQDETIRSTAQCTNDEIFQIFTIPFKWGNPDNGFLAKPDAIVLSESLSQKLFGEKNPVGQTLTAVINSKDENLTITGVYNDLPENSSLQAECFVNNQWGINSLNKIFRTNRAGRNWRIEHWSTWVLLDKNADVKSIEAQMPDFLVNHLGEHWAGRENFLFHSLKDYYLHSSDITNIWSKLGNYKNVRLFSIIALLVVLAAIFNYIILSTAISSQRAKEIGIRKTNGADNRLLEKQFIGESFLVALTSLPFALLLAWLALPAAGKLFNTELHIIGSNVWLYIVLYLFLAMFVGVASGVYSASYLSRIRVIDVLKKQTNINPAKLSLRSVLVVCQLVIFCSFVASAFIVRSQYQFSLKKDMGYKSDNVFLVPVYRNIPYKPFMDKLKSNPNIINAGGTNNSLPATGCGSISGVPCDNNPDKRIKLETLSVNYNFLETMGITPLEGRLFSEEFGNDVNCVVLNETAVKQLGITDPIGKSTMGKPIIGVVKDFNIFSVQNEIPPIAIDLNQNQTRQIAIAYKPGTRNLVFDELERYWDELMPDIKFRCMDIQDLYVQLYSSEKRLGTIISISALFTAIISALGLLGLTLFDTRCKTKEVGIKKALGGSRKDIILTLGKSNLILVLVSNVFSIPISYFVINKWLESYTYRTPIHFWIFILTGVLTLLITFITIGWQSWKSASMNPVEALRFE